MPAVFFDGDRSTEGTLLDEFAKYLFNMVVNVRSKSCVPFGMKGTAAGNYER